MSTDNPSADLASLPRRYSCPSWCRKQYQDEGFLLGVCVALSVIYSMDRDPAAVLPVEVVTTINEDDLLAFAIREQEYELPLIRKTVAEVKRRKSA